MRAGILLSIALHVVFVALALFGAPRLLQESTNRPIEAELVRPDEAPEFKEEPKPEEKTKDAAWDPLPQKTEPWPEAQPQQQREARAEPEPQQAPPQQEPQNQPAQQQSQSAPGQQSGPAPKTEAKPSIFDPASIPAVMNLPNAPESGFDDEATTAANISNDERAAFKAHLRKCWRLPAGLSATQTTRVVLRINLKRDGKLANEPVLIEASASRDGPAIMQAALRALKDCQPYRFLPPEKYAEWRLLDLSFSPRDMAGG